MKRINYLLSVVVVSMFALPVAASDQDQPLFAIDDGVRLLFYDVSSRRFRTARDAFIKRDFDTASRDLMASAGHLRLESARNDERLGVELAKVADQLEALASNLTSPDVGISDLDPVYARAHWLLAQQYLDWAERSRDAKRHKNAGRYLWATAHHLERAVIWSNTRVDKQLQQSLEKLIDMANDLSEGADPHPIYKNKPIRATRRILEKLGGELNLKIYHSPAPVNGP